MIELLKLTPFFHSHFGWQFPRHQTEPAEPWKTVLQRLPQLSATTTWDHIRIFFQGEQIPYEPRALRHIATIRPWITAEFIGPPKALKSTTLRSIHNSLSSLNVAHHIIPEPRRIDYPDINDMAAYNVYRALRAAARLELNSAENESGGEKRRVRNFEFHEQGFLHAIMFAGMLDRTSSWPKRQEDIIHAVEPFVRRYDLVVMMHTSPKTSLARRSRLGLARLEAFRDARLEFPDQLSGLTKHSDRPIIFIDIDTDGKSARDIHDLTLGSIGTAARGFDR